MGKCACAHACLGECVHANDCLLKGLRPLMRASVQVLSPHLLRALTHKLAEDYEEVQSAQAGEGGSSHSLCQVRALA